MEGRRTKKATPVAHEREIFYVGGRWIQDAEGGQRFGEQMYVERLIPTAVSEKTVDRDPIIFIHGATRSGVVSISSRTRKYLLYLLTAIDRIGSRSPTEDPDGHPTSYLKASSAISLTCLFVVGAPGIPTTAS